MRFTVKLGGSILEEAPVRAGLFEQIARLKSQGDEIILVHGGGKSLSRRLEQMKIPSRFVDGLRVTDAETLRVAVMVLAGEVNQGVVAEIGGLGVRAVGISGADAGAVRCIPVSESPASSGGLGFVGRPVRVERELFDLLLERGFLPVVSSLALGEDFQIYNVNADQMACVCAAGTGCAALIYLTDVPGVRDADGSVLPALGQGEIERMRAQGTIRGGMLPKTRSCVEALQGGVRSVYILPGRSPEILNRFSSGTLKEGTWIHANNEGN